MLSPILLICLFLCTTFTNSMGMSLITKSEIQTNKSSGKTLDSIHDRVRLASVSNSTLQYFGYWGLGMYGLDGNISIASDHSNLVFVSDVTFAALEVKIKQAETLKLQSMIMVQGIVFPWQQFSMYVDWQSRWDQFQTSIVMNHSDSIAGFYIFDEPFHNFDVHYNGTDKEAAALRFNLQLTQLADYIKAKNPGKAITLTYAYIEIEPYVSKFGIQNSFDWIGFNCYLDFGPVCSETNLIRYFSILNNLRKPQHQFLLTLDAYNSQQVCIVNESKQNEIIDRINFVLSWTQLNIPVVALTPFLYQEVHDPVENLCGDSTMPLVYNKLKTIAQTFIHKNVSQNPIALNRRTATKTQCALDDLVTVDLLTGAVTNRITSHPLCIPKCEKDDYVRRDENGTETERWLSAPLCIPKCEGENLVQRNEKNIIINVWMNASTCSH